MKTQTNKKYLAIQIILSILTIALMPIYLFFDMDVVTKLIIKNEIPFPFDPILDQIYVNQEVLYQILVWFIPMTIAIALSFYMVWVLKIRKKTLDFSELSKFEKIAILTPILYLVVKIILTNIGEHTFKEFIFIPALPAKASLGWSEPETNGIYNIIQTVFNTVNILLPIFLFWPWLSYLGFWRKKKQAETAAKK